MQEAEKTFSTLHAALKGAVNFFLNGSSSNGAPLTQQQVVDVLGVYNTLLSVNESGSREICEYIAQRSIECGFIRFLSDMLAQPFHYVHELDNNLPQAFLSLRIKAVQSLQRLFTVCAELGEQLSTLCFRVATEEDLVPQLLRALTESPHEPLRLSVAETLFAFLLCTRDGLVSFVASNGIGALCSSLIGDSSPAVRSVCASVLRELVNTYASEFTSPVIVSVFIRALDDTCPDVRTLSAEIIQQTLHLCVEKISFILRDSRCLLVPLQRIFDQESVSEVLEAAALLIETCCRVAFEMHICDFFLSVVNMNLVRPLIIRLCYGGKASFARARALRLLFQYIPAMYELPLQLLHDKEALAILLKEIVDAGRGGVSSGCDSALIENTSVELALCLAIILTQSPAYREGLIKELRDYPQWVAAMKDAMFFLLKLPPHDYFRNIELLDVTGHHLNALCGVEWGADQTPQSKYAWRLFREQSQRVNRLQKSILSNNDVPGFLKVAADKNTTECDGDEREKRKVHLTFFLLVFVTNITFNVGSHEKVGMTPSEPFSSRPRAVSCTTLQVKPFDVTDKRRQGSTFALENSRGSVDVTTSKIGRELDVGLASNSDEVIIAYDKFNSSMSIVMKYAQHYSRTRRKPDNIVETNDGYKVRMSRLKNPWHVVVSNERLKTWQVNDLKVGDLFYFSIPFDDLGIKTVDLVLYRAQRHILYFKKELVTTPQVKRGRRCFLSDMLKNVMPNIFKHLEDLRLFLQRHGKDGVKFPIFLFRDKELHFGERALHPGNLIEVISQLEYYFSHSVSNMIGVDNEHLMAIAEQLDESENVIDAQNNAASCVSFFASHEANDKENIKLYAPEDDDYGHGTISSESEIDF